MKIRISTLVLIAISSMFSFRTIAQTMVSGGIYSNAIWTAINSPYIVTSTVVVFPGVSLTIEPGVTVKFNDYQQLEIRQASLFAEGTSTDSIIFTSNSTSPTSSIWNNVYFNDSNPSRLNYCRFSYATDAIYAILSGSNTLYLKHSNIYKNQYALHLSGKCSVDSCNIFNNQFGADECSNNCVFNFCNIFNNQFDGLDIQQNNVTVKNCHFGCNGNYGIYSGSSANSTIADCIFDYNGECGVMAQGLMSVHNCNFFNNNIGLEFISNGINITQCLFQYNTTGLDCYNGTGGLIENNIIEYNSIGMSITSPANTISCNSVQNNTSFDVKYLSSGNSSCVINNYWGTTNSSVIDSNIYDGYDNISYGLLSYVPFYTTPCTGVGSSTFSAPNGCTNYLFPTSVTENLIIQNEINVFPNPFTTTTTITFNEEQKNATIKVIDLFGREIKIINFSGRQLILDKAEMKAGIYFVQSIDKQKHVCNKKIIIQ